jgi:glutathione S-transferase
MIQFYGAPMSSSGRTHWMLEEVGVPYEYNRVNTRDRASYSAAFLAMSPGGKVPAIDDDGFRLFESIAINYYLAEKYKPELLGNDTRDRALVHQWSLWAMTNLQPELLAIMSHSALLPESERDPKKLDSARAAAAPLIGLLDRALGKDEYLVGGRFSVADVNVGSVVNIAKFLGLLADAPAASAWLERLRARPAFQRAAGR